MRVKNTKMDTLRIPDHVHESIASHGGSVVLDTRAGQWFALNETARLLWQELSRTKDFEATVRTFIERYPGVPEDRIRSDATSLVDSLAERKLILFDGKIVPETAKAWTDRRDGVSVLLARDLIAGEERHRGARLALAVGVMLAKLPFGFTAGLLSAGKRRRCRRDATQAEVARAVLAVGKVARGYPGRAACLELSLAAVVVAAFARRRVDLVIGVADDPYRFHAWTEVHGVPVLAAPEPAFMEFRPVVVL